MAPHLILVFAFETLHNNTLKMVYFYVITLLAVITSVSASSNSGNDGSDICLYTTSLKFIEQALANISKQLGHVGTRNPSNVGESLTGVTSLLQLSLLRELLGEYKKGSLSDKQQGLAILSHIELLLNTTIEDLASRLDTIESLLQGLPSNITSLQKQVNSLSSNIKSIKSNTDLLLRHSNISHSTLTSIDDKLDDDSNEYTASPLLHSCEEIKSKWPSSPSDYYIIADSHGHARHVYCYMEELCNSRGGWMRVAYLNMTDSNEKCPDEFRLYSKNVRACGRPVSSGGSCAGITFPSGNIEYSQVCGKVIGYQFRSTDALDGNDINGAYIDGISLTHVVLVNTFGVLCLDRLKTTIQVLVHVVLVVLRVLNHLLVQTITVSLVIQIMIGNINFILMIPFGMAKVVVVLRDLVVLDPIFHGFVNLWDTLQLTPLK